jgi:hypothetical protein
VIRFNLMCTHAINRPGSGSSSKRYFMARCHTFLPIQDDLVEVTSRNTETNIKKVSGVRFEPDIATAK